ncbi:MAG: hypothetical protein J07HX64_02701 [halophilic archaeon J07HX64]|nr:MAG: hypothetical protein J07HX64_02701 [halophilic archaeon J07HX64]
MIPRPNRGIGDPHERLPEPRERTLDLQPRPVVGPQDVDEGEYSDDRQRGRRDAENNRFGCLLDDIGPPLDRDVKLPGREDGCECRGPGEHGQSSQKTGYSPGYSGDSTHSQLNTTAITVV